MKHKLLTVLALTLILALAVPAVGAEEPLPPQLEYIDAQLNIFLPKVAVFQQTYFKEYSNYYQSLGSHSTIPNGADGSDKLADHPTDQDTSLVPLWEETGLPTEIAWSFTINTYVSPKGAGYMVTICTSVATDEKSSNWCRVEGVGPEGGTTPWYLDIVPEV